ncbi:MAG: DUF1670 domain-containing protein [bacterium]|nr:DUF1670 domain-containing protein [bacterium]
MGRRDQTRQASLRLQCKTLDAKFLNEVRQGLNCSPFEANAVLQVVREVYFPFLDQDAPTPPPGKISLMAIDAEEPPGKPVAECKTRVVCLTLHRGPQDDRLLLDQNPAAFRQARILDLCQEALSQGALLTCEDLACRIFFVSTRTITRDLDAIRKADPDTLIPLRSNVHDIGPVLTHRTRIVQLALQGKTTTQICQATRHSPAAIGNYLATFSRCAQLARQDMQVGQIAFLLRRGRGLVQSYLDLLAECESDKNMAYHLDEFLRLGSCGAEKKGAIPEATT